MCRLSVYAGFTAVLVCFTTGLIHLTDDARFPAAALPTLSGYLPLTASAKMFYAYYEATEPGRPLPETPIIAWFQGGPGCSSMTGSFYELGPWRVGPDLRLHQNQAPWNNRYGLLFLDNPVGTGYSIAERDEDVPVDEDQVVQQLHAALLEFFGSQPSLSGRPFFVAGESYAGKYVPALGRRLASSPLGILRLDGLIVGNGLTDPVVQVRTHAETAYSFGLIDKQQKLHVDKLAERVVGLVEAEDWKAAYKGRTGLLKWIENASAVATVLDVRRAVPYHCMDNGTEFLSLFFNSGEVKSKLKADPAAAWVACNARVRKIMSNDTMKSVKWMVDEMLEDGVPMLLYQGQFDIKDGVVSTEEWMRTLKWELKDEFFASERRIWRVGGSVAGYWRSLKPLTQVVVLGAGHQVPVDQPLRSQQMIQAWIEQQLYLPRSSV